MAECLGAVCEAFREQSESNWRLQNAENKVGLLKFFVPIDIYLGVSKNYTSLLFVL